MSNPQVLRIYLEGPMLKTARDGSFNFANVLKSAVEAAGWRVEWHLTGTQARARAPELDGYALYHAEAPTHDRALTFRRAYHYPFWNIEQFQQRWRFEVARSTFDPALIDPDKARHFVDKLRSRVLPGPSPSRGEAILVPLQDRIRLCRSFQTMSPIEMLDAVAATGRPVVATLHPKLQYDMEDTAALQSLVDRHRNLNFSTGSAALLRDCAFVATQNSAVAFDGFMLGKPAVLFGQIDFHHISLNVAELGVETALAMADSHAPDYDRYLYWFLAEKSINATQNDAGEQMLSAMRRGGWPI
ncbi:hypothetical protein RGQ15_04170 [Paracoccus sp. MBLB3053]|uniref:Polysaccharide pyruvyl transferase family protein n=1 Tax=Paracoccus aurantius TaxID=3073814 RepID=A0ABU2HQB4_9RHOB|nr:hypothetical protein [Paracoccus sp. MBLB3053]MDS9466779.1 hypothetical protein [Paracoccus sp. MBLB3053]